MLASSNVATVVLLTVIVRGSVSKSAFFFLFLFLPLRLLIWPVPLMLREQLSLGYWKQQAQYDIGNDDAHRRLHLAYSSIETWCNQ